MEYDNKSLDGKVGFYEKDHRYEYTGTKKKINISVTGVVGNYHEEFISEDIAKSVSKNKNSEYYGKKPKDIIASWERRAEEGTVLHAYGEDLLNDDDDDGEEIITVPNLTKAVWVPEIVEDLLSKYTLAKTELLVYSEAIDLAGQLDILLKKIWGEDERPSFSIYDWKFLKKKLEMTSYYNTYTRKYKMMKKPFHHLKDCNWIHYSIQLAIYQTMTGDPVRVREKVLIIVNDDGYELVPAYPMRVFWDTNSELQCVYEIYNGKYYDSRDGILHNAWPSDIKGR